LELDQIAKWLDDDTDEKILDDKTDVVLDKDINNETDYDALLKEVKQEIEDDKKENYFYKLFEEYKETIETEDDIYQEMIDELS